MLTISKFTYKNIEQKIRLHHPFKNEIMEKLRQVSGFNYSKTYNYWYVPYCKKTYNELKKISPINIEGKRKFDSIYINIDKSIKRITLIHPYNKELWYELRKIQSSYWQKKE